MWWHSTPSPFLNFSLRHPYGKQENYFFVLFFSFPLLGVSFKSFNLHFLKPRSIYGLTPLHSSTSDEVSRVNSTKRLVDGCTFGGAFSTRRPPAASTT